MDMITPGDIIKIKYENTWVKVIRVGDGAPDGYVEAWGLEWGGEWSHQAFYAISNLNLNRRRQAR